MINVYLLQLNLHLHLHSISKECIKALKYCSTLSIAGYDGTYDPMWERGLLPVSQRVKTSWGSHSLLVATLILLKNAYQDFQNEWYVTSGLD